MYTRGVCFNRTNPFQNPSTKTSSLSPPTGRSPYGRQRRLLHQVIFAVVLMLFLPGLALADQVTLQWDPNNPTPEGYCVYLRQPGGTYDYNNPVWPADGAYHTETNCTITGLVEGATYHFIVRAHVGSDFSGDSNEVTYQVPLTVPPVAEAGRNQSVQESVNVLMNGSGSYDPKGGSLAYQWTQSSGPAVTLSGTNKAQCTFTAPTVTSNTTLSFELTVTDDSGLSDSDTCIVMVGPAQQEPDNDNDGTPDAQDTDDDNDGMPDTWENRYGLNPFSDDAGGDADNDGVSNWEEYQAGTDPTEQNGNQAPLKPMVTSPADDETGLNPTLWLKAAAFDDPNPADRHQQTQWRISTGQTTVMDKLITGKNLTQLKVPYMVLGPSTQHTVRVRFYDDAGEPSPWSDDVVFTTAQDSNDTNHNCIPDNQEVSAHTDMNGDGTPDIYQESTIKSVQTHDNQYLAGVSIEDSANAIEVECAASVDPMALGTPPANGDDMAYGLLGYKIRVNRPGDHAVSTIYLSDPVGPQAAWVCYDSVKGWLDCSTTTTAVDTEGFVVQRNLRDGGAEDADGAVNGVIVDLSGPEAAISGDGGESANLSDGSDAASGGGGGGGGCFIGSIFGRR